MCWSAAVSINTYLLSTFACALAYFNNIISIPHVLFLQSFILMQLLEYFVWINMFNNEILSKLALILILSQPIFSLLLLKRKEYLLPLIIGYLIFILVVLVYKPLSTITFKMAKAQNGHLAWYWLDYPLVFIIIWLGFLTIRLLINKDYWVFLFMVITALLFYIWYNKTKTWGSLWCWIANLVGLLLIFQVIWKDFGPEIKKMILK